MGLLDQLANGALGALTGAQGGHGSAGAPAGMGDILSSLLGGQGGQDAGQGGGAGNLLASVGGLAGLLAMAQKAGLGDIVSSWISTGQNKAISGDQLSGLLGGDQMSAIAQKLGLSPDAASQMLAGVLPQAVDKLTPDGQVPQGDMLSQGLSMLQGLTAGR